MRRYSHPQLAYSIAASAALWLVVAWGCMWLGSTGIRWPRSPEEFAIRAQPVLIASLVGAALAAAGVVYQAILRNPLADPYLLGVSSGAALAGYIWKFTFAMGLAALLGSGGALSQQAFAFAGAVVSVSVVFMLSMRRGRLEPLTLLLVGVIVNAVNGSIFLLINAMFKDLTAISTFLVGSIQTNLSTQQITAAAVCIGLGYLVLMYISGQLNAAVLSEGEAQSLGVRIHGLRWAGLAVASLVTASAVAISGPIGFVGLVCPHLARLLVGSDQRRLLPMSTALGAVLLMTADAVSRLLIDNARTWLPVGVLTGLMGGPFFLLLLWQNRRRRLVGAQL